MQTTEIGNQAETAACEYLQEQGYTIFSRNWKLPKRCEIDIVAGKNRIIYFVEVKYRRTAAAGDGLDYITPLKLKQMRLAAREWSSHHGWHGAIELAAIAVSGADFVVTDCITAIDS